MKIKVSSHKRVVIIITSDQINLNSFGYLSYKFQHHVQISKHPIKFRVWEPAWKSFSFISKVMAVTNCWAYKRCQAIYTIQYTAKIYFSLTFLFFPPPHFGLFKMHSLKKTLFNLVTILLQSYFLIGLNKFIFGITFFIILVYDGNFKRIIVKSYVSHFGLNNG